MAVDWTKHKLLDRVGWRSGLDGDSAYARFYLLSADVAYLPKRGDSAPSTVGITWKVDDVDASPISPYNYIVSVSFRRFINGPGMVGRTYKNLKAEWDLEMGSEEFHMPPAWWAVEPVSSPPRSDMNNANATVVGTTTVADGAWNPDSITGYHQWQVGAKLASYPQLYMRYAKWATLAAADIGPLPFTQPVHLRWIDHTVKCKTFSVTYYRDSTHGTGDTMVSFVGVNGTIPSDFGIPNYNVSGKWRAVRQQVRRIKDDAGDAFWQVTRTAMHVPHGITDTAGNALFWDSTKCGGTWSWPTWP